MQRYYDPSTGKPVSERDAIARLPPQNIATLSPRDIATQAGLWVLIDAPTPDGYVPIGPEQYTEYPEGQYAEAWFATRSAKDQQAMDAQVEAANIAYAIEHLGGTIRALDKHLRTFGFAIPCNSREAQAHITNRIGSADATDAENLSAAIVSGCYSVLTGAGFCDSQIAQLWGAMQG